MEQFQQQHLAMVVLIMTVRHEEQARGRCQRGYGAQRQRRHLERTVRLRAVKLAGRLQAAGHRWHEVASRLGVSASALARWRRLWRSDRLRPEPRGRPVDALPSELARRITATLHLLGPLEGLPILQSLFPHVPRAELEHRLRRYRARYIQDHHVVVQALQWRRPGTVWAMDFAEPPAPIDGQYRYILAVRDLASGRGLLWLPVRRKTAAAVRAAVLALLRPHRPPRVLKADNDKAFKADTVRALLAGWQVEYLFSPPYFPEYNGACESGIGTLKTYTHHEAARNSRPGGWSCDDVEAARLRANELARPRGLEGPTPDRLWQQRCTVSTDERRAFREQLARRRLVCLEKVKNENKADLNEVDRAAIERRAIAGVLVACGFLLVRKRRISPPIKSKFWSRIRR